jgi:translation initiation factor IF-3
LRIKSIKIELFTFHINSGGSGIGKHLQINGEIRDEKVRVIDESGLIGIMSSYEALHLASGRNLDLVKIGPQSVPPVCKVMDYGKFCFERKKKEKEIKKSHKIAAIKEIRLSVNIGEGDMQTKVEHAREFIENGDKIKALIKFKGREGQHPEIGYKVMNSFYKLCSDFASIEIPANLESRQLFMTLVKLKRK